MEKSKLAAPNAVLNGIAYDANQEERLFVTGKLWPSLFEIKPIQTRAKLGQLQKSTVHKI